MPPSSETPIREARGPSRTSLSKDIARWLIAGVTLVSGLLIAFVYSQPKRPLKGVPASPRNIGDGITKDGYQPLPLQERVVPSYGQPGSISIASPLQGVSTLSLGSRLVRFSLTVLALLLAVIPPVLILLDRWFGYQQITYSLDEW